MKKTKYLPVIGLLISAIFLYFALRNINFPEVLDALKHTDVKWVIFSVIFTPLSLFLRGLRWKFILQSVKNCKLIDMFYVVNIAFLANNILPLRMGEFVGTYVNAKKHNISKSSSFATIVVSRIFDGISLILLAIILTVYLSISKNLSPSAINFIRKVGPLVVFLFFGSLLFLLGMLNKREMTLKLTKKIFFFVPENIIDKIAGIVDSFIGGLKVLHNPKDLFLTTIASFSIWIVEAFFFYIISVALGLEISYPIALFVMVVIAFGVLMPSSPSFVGVYEMACILGLGIFGISKNIALTFALLAHTIQFIIIVALGIFSLGKEKLSWSEIKKSD